jgi:hypothetical protein
LRVIPVLATTMAQTLVAVLYTPAALLLFVSLWAFPLAAWFWRRHTGSLSAATWAFLEKIPRQAPMPQQTLLHPRRAFTVGLIGGAAYGVLLLIVRIVLLTALPEAVRSTYDYRLNFSIGQVAVAALLQALVALVVAAKVRPLGGVHGLFAAFVAGCVMTVEILGLNLLFGGTITPIFVWTIFSQVVNAGALLALPCALIASALAGKNRVTRLPSTQVMRTESVRLD